MSAPPERTAAPEPGSARAGVVLVHVSEGIATVTLNRPDARNALNAELRRALVSTFEDLEADDGVDVVILTGADPAFCAGLDLKELGRGDHDLTSTVVATRGPRTPLPSITKPLIGAVNGVAITGGFELVLQCDFLVASERARFADTHARVGAMPGAGLTIRLPQLVGLDRARRMSLTGEFVDARTAYEWGLVTEVVPHDDLLARARELAAAIGSIPAANVREVRRMYQEIGDLAGPDAWHHERELAEGWMAARFDASRLAAEREAIMARGRGRTPGP